MDENNHWIVLEDFERKHQTMEADIERLEEEEEEDTNSNRCEWVDVED